MALALTGARCQSPTLSLDQSETTGKKRGFSEQHVTVKVTAKPQPVEAVTTWWPQTSFPSQVREGVTMQNRDKLCSRLAILLQMQAGKGGGKSGRIWEHRMGMRRLDYPEVIPPTPNQGP